MPTPLAARFDEVVAPGLRRWWAIHCPRILWIAVAIMAVIALARQGYEFWRLVFCTADHGAIDLRFYHGLVQGWFAGRPIYEELRTAVHPPATYLMLWPFLGWLSLSVARWFCAATMVAAIVWLGHLCARHAGMRTRAERTFAFLFVLSMYPAAITVGNGQLTLYLVPALLTGVLMLGRKEVAPGREAIASLLLLAALVKPPLAAPFFWIVLFVAPTIRPCLAVASAYVGLTLLSASFQPEGLFRLLRQALENSAALAVEGGYANIHMGLRAVGAEWALLPCSILLFLLAGVWIRRHRDGDPWHLLGVIAIVARFWTYHRLYDDLLILFPLVALFRVARGGAGTRGSDVIAVSLIAVSWIFLLAPGTLARVSWGWPFRWGQSALWLAMLVFLVWQAAGRGGSPAAAQPRGQAGAPPGES
ncbi:MAG: DUF2029 domain-containing protein [Planctomycetes bacterium]|nr:DUF2029 domain-containing protein [Planctomycetota bacterium]